MVRLTFFFGEKSMLRLTPARYIVLALGFALSGCGSGAKPAPGMGCALNSDCAMGLVCTFGLCHSACTVNNDCPAGQLCVRATAPVDGGTVVDGGTLNVCQLPKESTCVYNSQCTPLVCARDEKCRNECQTSVDCVDPQVCTDSKVCALVSQLAPGTNDVPVVTTRLMDGGAGASGAAGGASASGGAGGKGASGGAGVGTGGAGGAPNKDGGVDRPPACLPGLAGFHPSNIPASVTIPSALPSITQTVASTFDTDALAFSPPIGGDGGQPVAMTVTLGDGRSAALVLFKNYTLSAGVTLSVTGEPPLIIAADGNVEIDGTITATQSATNHWYCGGAPGPSTAARGGICALNSCSGGGAAGETTSSQQIGSGGGAFCGIGGTGSAPVVDGGTSPTPPPGGMAYGTPDLVPLVGGASSGSTDNIVGQMNHGGGAIEIAAGGSVTVDANGVINMGGGADHQQYAVGGGSGGGILLEAPTVNLKGAVVANGASGAGWHGAGSDGQVTLTAAPGGGTLGGAGSSATTISGGNGISAVGNWSGGGGGAGRIRINTGCGGALNLNSSSLMSPGSSTPCFTTGALK
jgi:hypothetical protein